MSGGMKGCTAGRRCGGEVWGGGMAVTIKVRGAAMVGGGGVRLVRGGDTCVTRSELAEKKM